MRLASRHTFRLSFCASTEYNAGVLRMMDFSSLLSCLTRERLVEVGRALGLTLPSNARKERQVEAFREAAPGQLAAVVGLLLRAELKVACRQHGLPDGGPARFELAKRLLVAAGIEDAAIAPSFAAEHEDRDLPG